jgi:endogenous inhibitor of DNA gyrase (YacG/DUF329 family)
MTARKQRAKRTLNCANCGKPFESEKAWALYCSTECRLTAFYLRKSKAIKRAGSPDANSKS